VRGQWPPVPVFPAANRSRQIADYYRRLIADGHVGEHEQLPGRAEMASLWDVSLSTAARGVALLRRDGLVYSTTRGVFVAAASSGAPERISGRGRYAPGSQEAGRGERNG
jgi:DNA-binding GntR family transcriptional regulator